MEQRHEVISTRSQQTHQILKEGLARWVKYSRYYGADVRSCKNSMDIDSLPDDKCRDAAERITQYLSIFDAAEPEILKRQDEVELLRAALRHLKLKSVDDSVFSMLDKGDIIEIYDSNFVQLYRNLVFMRYCSYDLVSLVTHSHSELYAVAEDDYAHLHRALFDVFNSAWKATSLSVKPYLLKEKFGQRDHVFEICLKVCCPLVNEKGEKAAFIVTNHCSDYHVRVLN